MSLRKLERSIVKAKCYNDSHSTKNFGTMWDDFKKEKHGDKIPKNTSKKKQHHYDNSNHFIQGIRNLRDAVIEMKENRKKEKEIADAQVEA